MAETSHNAYTRDGVEDEVKRIVSEIVEVPAEKITRDTNLMNDLGMDDMDEVQIVLKLEETFNVQIADEALPQLCRISDYIDYIMMTLYK